MTLGSQTVTSLLKSKPPVPYAQMLRQVTHHVKKLQEELQAEAETNIEFEDSSRRTFEFLTSQLKALKSAFNTLSDTLLDELEQVSQTVTEELNALRDHPRIIRVEEQTSNLKAQLNEFSQETFEKLKRLAEQDCFLESKVDQLSSDMDTVLQVIPKIEDSYLKGDRQLADRQNTLGGEVSKLHDMLAVERTKSNNACDRLDSRMKEISLEFDEKILRCQKSLQQQMEYVSRLVIARGGTSGSSGGADPRDIGASAQASFKEQAGSPFSAKASFYNPIVPSQASLSGLTIPPVVNSGGIGGGPAAAASLWSGPRSRVGSPGPVEWSSNIGQSASARFAPAATVVNV
ncbi:unnamed protein product [Amoebophrya sp. A25]|nr:unnamed protein product [Amoebophrya sp. A25]|eukprot:GSA25T00017635001.1